MLTRKLHWQSLRSTATKWNDPLFKIDLSRSSRLSPEEAAQVSMAKDRVNELKQIDHQDIQQLYLGIRRSIDKQEQDIKQIKSRFRKWAAAKGPKGSKGSNPFDNTDLQQYLYSPPEPGCLGPGDLVEFLSGSNFIIGVIVATNNRGSAQFDVATIQREIVKVSLRSVTFACSNFMNREFIKSHAEVNGDSSDSIVSLAPDILQAASIQLRLFKRLSASSLREIAPRIPALHAFLARNDQDRIMSLPDIFSALNAEYGLRANAYNMYALHSRLQRSGDLYLPLFFPSSYHYQLYAIRSHEHLRAAENTAKAIRAGPKSKGLKAIFHELSTRIDTYRSFQAENKAFTKINHPFSKNTVDLVNSVKEFTETPALSSQMSSSPLYSLLPAALKQLDRYPEAEMFARNTFILFLTELGVYTPWENVPSREARWRAAVGLDSFEDIAQSTGGYSDSLTCIRHDFGSIPVYCIDNENPDEIDDGVSIESTDNGSEVWVHVHVANPTAFIDIEHPISRRAAKQASTFYFPDKTWPMLPKSLVDRCNLSPGVPRETLTVSVLLDVPTGRVIDRKIRCGLVNNIQTLTYTEADALIKSDSAKGLEQTWKDLKVLSKVTKKLRSNRQDSGMIEGSSFISNFEVALQSKDAQSAPLGSNEWKDHPTLFKETDTKVILVPQNMSESQSRQVVEEIMIMAGRAAAKWGQSHGISLPFRYQDFDSNDTLNEMQKKKLMNDISTFKSLPKEKANNSAEGYFLLRQITSNVGPARNGLEPKAHFLMGIEDAYTRVTSPLRRYCDMLVHWQLQAQLLREAKSDAFSGLSAAEMKEEIEKLNLQEAIGLEKQRQVDSFYKVKKFVTDYLESFLQQKPFSLRCFVLGTDVDINRGVLIDYGLEAIISTTSNVELKPSQVIECTKVLGVGLADATITLSL
ncbi:hypothetical protein CANCADRAFT_102843 [Tortispora caseinolytica NRRL Y-17796]|uniref:RNB domain-containing protein n=1 Tax=Tortispora caseinolytica NRRL Y-17796 TaxID=767744 RepID=A0A1E4TEJ5_9ASCO|nr:hypothetical protein CANCADRAFT_102843 [Tortispora caseinolytica NRRL Y-17796]